MQAITEAEIKTMQREAQDQLRAGNLEAAIQMQSELVEKIFNAGPQAIHSQPVLAEQLEKSASQLVDSLRWGRRYEEAIAIQERLLSNLPEIEDALRLGAANLRVEAGEGEAGLEQIRAMAASSPDNYWYQISLGAALLYLEQFEEAEKVLRSAADMPHARKIDRAMAQEYLFNLYRHQGKTVEALAAWREAGRLNSSLRSKLLGDVCHMLIYQRRLDEAREILARDTVQVRKAFFQGLIAFFENKPAEAIATWRTLLTNNPPDSLKAGHDAYAKTCLYLTEPAAAILTLQPLVDQGQTSFERIYILSLAYAQQGDLERAMRNFAIALRLGDMERPRKTRASENRRIFDPFYGLLFVTIPLHPSMRNALAPVFK